MHVTSLLCKDGREKARNFGWEAFRYCSAGRTKEMRHGETLRRQKIGQ